MSPSFHIGILPSRPAKEVAELAAFAETLGFAGIWVADSQSIFRDAFQSLALCAVKTERMALATGVTNPVTRHPAVLAGAFATLNELSGGRAVLGIGVGESALQTIKQRPPRLARLEEITLVLRGLLAGDEVEFDGESIKLTWGKADIPIVFASSGPKSLRLAGKVADGVLMQVGSIPSLVRYALDRVDGGRAEAQRPSNGMRRYLRLACSVGYDRESARNEVRGYAAAAAGTVFANVPRDALPQDVWEDVRAMKEHYDYYQHASSAADHKDLLTDRVLDAVAIAGTPDEAIPRFRELIELGLDGFVTPITTSDPRESMRILAEDVIAHL